MALIVEDDTGLATAEAYVSIANSEIHMTEMYGTSEALWNAASDADKEQALRRAARYIDSRYDFVGTRLNAVQALEWPRSNAIEQTSTHEIIDGVHQRVKDASVELALMVIKGITLFPVTSEGGNVKSITVGPIKKEYSEKAVNREPVFHLIDRLLRYLIFDDSAILRS